MPSLQTALPPELANNAIRLYRECLRRAKYIGQKKFNTELLITMVREQFKKNMHETDPDKILKMKDERVPFSLYFWIIQNYYHSFITMSTCSNNISKCMLLSPSSIEACLRCLLYNSAARGLINHMLYESENLSGRKFSKTTDGS
ncbi:hypothetical protein SASPL_131319 [Salvia splendens]|uniref:Complex 1 LYR protein domain-containing protein n=1 Tax=Salvia splendens TaxID=180675 RepID=A0A8X8ZLH1_SALSN|nr:hypothetical protein SASPL_131319 [Salvia splendens]